MIKAGILGGSSLVAGELARLLLRHPDVELCWVNSTTAAGKRIDHVHPGLIGETDMAFVDEMPFGEVDVIFLCLHHSKPFLAEHQHEIPAEMRIIDLSADYRIEDITQHDYVYGMPELNRRRMVPGTIHVGIPGPLAVATQLALIPPAKNLLINSDVQVTTIAGSTIDQESGDYSWRHDNVTLYQPFCHPALAEVRQAISQLQRSFSSNIELLPMKGPFSRGIFATVYFKCNIAIEEITKLYEDYYDDHNFTFVTSRNVTLKDVVNTNKCLLHLEKIDDRLLITVVIDNLLKGAAGTAVHNMNLLFGLHERVGLMTKASAF